MTQRVIKYRAWDNKYNCFSEEPFFRLLISKDGQVYNSEGDTWYGPGERYIIQFFTGLTDKHGKEIYEGDIRKEILDGLFVGDPQREHYFVMVYIQEWTMFAWLSITSGEYEEYLKDGAEALDTEMYWTYPAGQDEPNNVELVGNIYTTPELIDPK